MYQRFSAHLTSVDIPDFSDLKETARETANRVEVALSRGTSVTSNDSVNLGGGAATLTPPNSAGLGSGTAGKSQISRTASLSLGPLSGSTTSLNTSSTADNSSSSSRNLFRAQRSKTQSAISRSQSVMVATGKNIFY